MHGNPPEFDFQVTIFHFRKRNKISSLPVYVLHKTRNKVFSRRSRAKTAKKCTKKVVQSCCFAFQPIVFSDVLVAVKSDVNDFLR